MRGALYVAKIGDWSVTYFKRPTQPDSKQRKLTKSLPVLHQTRLV